MPTLKNVEELEAWKKARELAKAIYTLTALGPLARDFVLRDQLRAAAVSAVSNIAEGFERGGDKEFRQFLAQAKGSTGEIVAQMCVALDAGYIDQNTHDRVKRLATETSRLLGGLIRYLTTSGMHGSKFGESELATSRNSMVNKPRSRR